MLTYRLLVALSFLSHTSMSMNPKKLWENGFYTTYTIKLEAPTEVTHDSICKQTLTTQCDSVWYDTFHDKGDFTLKVDLEQNRNFSTASYTPSLLQYLCCIPQAPQEPLLQQEITLIDNEMDKRSYQERRFSGTMGNRGSQALPLIFHKIHGFRFEYDTYEASSKNDPTHAIIVAPSISSKNSYDLVVFGFRPFNPLCTLQENMSSSVKIFVTKTGDAIVVHNTHKNTLTLFKLTTAPIIKDSMHDTFFSFV